MRTRGNGEELSWDGLEEDLQTAGLSITGHELARDARELAARERAEAFDDGFQLGAKVEHRVAVEAVVTAALHILGKDVGDGEINLGSLGRWWPSFEVAIGPNEHEVYDYRESIRPASK